MILGFLILVVGLVLLVMSLFGQRGLTSLAVIALVVGAVLLILRMLNVLVIF